MWLSAAAIATISGKGIVDREYLDETLEPDRRQQIPDVLWRCIRSPRGGRRGLATKVRHINEGIAQGCYETTFPFVNQSGFEYAKRWKFQVIGSLLQGTAVWEVESSSSEGSVVVLERPAAKARPSSPSMPSSTDRPSGSQQIGQSSCAFEVPEPVHHPSSGSRSLEAEAKPAPKAKERILRPRLYLPDTVVWFDRGNKAVEIGSGPEPVGRNFEEVSNYSAYRGFETYVKSDSPEYPKFILFLDWHQVLDRSRTEGRGIAHFQGTP